MDFKFIDNANQLYKQKHYLKNRDLSILEFQMRIMDLIYLTNTPFMERLNFIKIICNNLEEFISIRLPDADPEKVPQLIHTIESIYKELGDFLDYVNELNCVNLEDQSKSFYKNIADKSFRYIYAGESSKEITDEIKDVMKIKHDVHSVSVLYSNCSAKTIMHKNNSIKYCIEVPMSILLIDQYLEWYSDRSNSSDYFPKEISNIPKIDYYMSIPAKDMLLRTPYDSYDHVLSFIDQMCNHPNVVAIFITLYRTAKNSKIINSLLSAKASGKDVYVYVEPTARDNEEKNLKNIQTLTAAGIHVNCNYYNYKVHAKLFCAVDRNGKVFSHIGTGNYNEDTAKCYTDFHLLTANQSITLEALKIIMSIFRKDIYRAPGIELPLYSSPLNFRSTIIRLINREMKKGSKGMIRIKCNSLCDCAVIDKLYQAAAAGVNIRIICRTGCSISVRDNIQVRSKVGRYLEHDRIYIFGNGADCKAYISSADLLLRNINKRLEVLCEILDDDNRTELISTFELLWDDEYIHVLQDDGKWKME